jgi:hypothetical protein
VPAKRERAQGGEKPLDWLLLTNAPVDSFAAGREVVTRSSIDDLFG